MRNSLFSTLGAAGLLAMSLPASTNKLDVPIVETGGDGQMANCTSSTVTGLSAGGDGFLAVRSGPGSQYRKLAELHNGDVVSVFEHKGKWASVVYGDLESGECVSLKTRPVTNSKKGWVHTKWLKHLAG